MLLDKLWVRIRGSLLSLKEDFSLGEDIRRKAEGLLERLDLQEKAQDRASGSEQPSEIQQENRKQGPRAQTLEEIRQEFEELLRQKEPDKDRTSKNSTGTQNPRRLG